MTSDQPRPLEGRRIVVTRARSQASSLVAALTALGAEVIEIPTIEIVPLESYDRLDQALQSLQSYQWLIVTSANTVRILAERLAILGIEASALGSLRKVAIGSATARAMREQGIEVDLVPEQYVAESLVAVLGNQVSGSRILLARASIARDLIPEELTRRGATVDAIDAYQTLIPQKSIARIREAFANPTVLPDAVTFTSSSTVKNFVALWQEANLGPVPKTLQAISIGPITTATLFEYSWRPAAEAERHTVEGLVQTLIHSFSKGKDG